MSSIGRSTFQPLPNANFGKVLNTSAFSYTFPTPPKNGDNVSILASATQTSLVDGEFSRDMGERIFLVGNNGLISVVLNRVRKVNGSASEGIPASNDWSEKSYVVAFSANPATALVPGARTG